MADEELHSTERFGSVLAHDNASRLRRDTRWRSVVLQGSRGMVFRAPVLSARCCAAGITPSSTTDESVSNVAW